MANAITIKETKFNIGDTVKLTYKFKEGEKSKEQIFEGLLIKIKGESANKTFTIRKVTKDKIGIERIFSISSPYIDAIKLVKKGNVRRAKLYYVRNLSDRDLRIRLS